MQVKTSRPSPTKANLTIIAGHSELQAVKAGVLSAYQGKVKVAGFRAGKIPLEVLEKSVDQASLQNEFLQEAVEQLYFAAINSEKLRPVDNPQITIKKFVPYSTLEFDAAVEVLGEAKLPDYKKIKLAKTPVKVTDAEVKEVVDSLRQRLAAKKDVSRAARKGDQVFIDFEGTDAKTKEPISGADGKDYPLVLGSGAFIPGFEPEIVGMEADGKKEFTIPFPRDYGVASLRGRKVSFSVIVTKVQEVQLPKLDDNFAAMAGPVNTVAELKRDIKKQLIEEKRFQSERDYESRLVRKISDKTQISISDTLVDDQITHLWSDLQQNILYRGQTIKEFLENEGKTEAEYREEILKPQAYERVKGSLVLAEIAEAEGLNVTPEELEVRLQALKSQYQQDEQMKAELEKPEASRDIASRILTEKTLEKLKSYAAS